jgi:hypothetical protein
LYSRLRSLTLAVPGHRALLVGHVGSRHGQAYRNLDYILAAGSLAVPDRSSPGFVAVAVGNFVAGSRSGHSPAAEDIVLEAGIAGSLGCIDHKGRTL